MSPSYLASVAFLCLSYLFSTYDQANLVLSTEYFGTLEPGARILDVDVGWIRSTLSHLGFFKVLAPGNCFSDPRYRRQKGPRTRARSGYNGPLGPLMRYCNYNERFPKS